MKMKKARWLVVVMTAAMMVSLLSSVSFAATAEDPDEYTLYAGQDIDVGCVEVWNDADNLHVNYVITEDGWCITETHVHVGATLEDFPLSVPKHNPAPGQFDYQEVHDPGVTEYEYVIPLDGLSDNIIVAAHAVVTDAPKGDSTGIIYATRTGTYKGLYEIDVVNETVTLLKGFTGGADDVNNRTGYSNALAYDPAANKLYFTAPPSVVTDTSPLWSYDIDTDTLEKLCILEGSVVGAEFYQGAYYYIAERTNNLMKIDNLSPGCVAEKVYFDNSLDSFGNPGDFTFGDFAITDTGMLYGSTRVNPQMFFSLNINTGDYQVISTSDALDLQLAFGSNGILYGTRHGTGAFYEVDEDTGETTKLSLQAPYFADLAAGTLFIPQTETAWGDGERFTPKGNWATYMTYSIDGYNYVD